MSSTSIYTGIYLITSPSGKHYIGQSTDIDKRHKQYKNLYCKGQPKLYNSLKKHAPDNHTFKILHHCLEEELNLWERHYQEEYDVIGTKGLNCFLTKTDDKISGISDETRKKMSDSAKNKPPVTDETRKKMSDAAKNMTDDTRKKMSDAHIGKNISDDTRKKMSDAAKNMTDETRKKISASRLGKKRGKYKPKL
jgi:group I intron endonuclease